jgi:hypothetical protein
MGRIRFENDKILYLGSLIKMIKYKDIDLKSIYFGLIPSWLIHMLSKE